MAVHFRCCSSRARGRAEVVCRMQDEDCGGPPPLYTSICLVDTLAFTPGSLPLTTLCRCVCLGQGLRLVRTKKKTRILSQKVPPPPPPPAPGYKVPEKPPSAIQKPPGGGGHNLGGCGGGGFGIFWGFVGTFWGLFEDIWGGEHLVFFWYISGGGVGTIWGGLWYN